MGTILASRMEIAVYGASLFNSCKIAASSTQGHRHPHSGPVEREIGLHGLLIRMEGNLARILCQYFP